MSFSPPQPPGSHAVGQERASRLGRLVILGVVLGGIAVVGLQAFHDHPARTESLYCRGLFPLVRALLAPLGFLPFSVAEVSLWLAAAALVLKLFRVALGARSVVGRPVQWGKAVRRSLAWVVALGGLGLFCFEVTWGFHHARQPFAHHAGWTVEPRSVEELADLVMALAQEAEAERAACLQGFPGPDEQAVGFSLGGGWDGDPSLHAAWLLIGERYPVLAGRAVPVRRPLSSALMSSMGIAGIYSPFTAEAHVNAQVPDTQVAFVTAHEVAHGRGFAREDEANFIAYLVCRASLQARVRYSGSLQALDYARAALARADLGRARELEGTTAEGVRSDLSRQAQFWRSKQTVLWGLSASANDAYLKSQGQTAGVASYGRMVDLLLARRAALRP